MNPEELPSDFDHHGGTIPSDSREVLPTSLSSSDLDDWVSPYTLPPLPALRRNRGHSDQLKSPELPHQRVESGTYYAAAWGSPYATPSPRNNFRTSQPTARNVDFEFSSPSFPLHQQGQLPKSRPPRPRRKPLSERPNWLSDSEDSQYESGVLQGEKTPKGLPQSTGWSPSPDYHSIKPYRGHRLSESLVTITPDIFHVKEDSKVESEGLHHLSGAMVAEPVKMTSTEKPLPPLDRRQSIIDGEPKILDNPNSPTRPRPASIQSYQRPKKKVVWKGKTCIIALPLVDRASAGLPPLLSPQDIQYRIDQWIKQGYRVRGFELTDDNPESFIQNSGQSRPVFPNDTDMMVERKSRRYDVHIPNQAEWEAWVTHLKEEKLRALGVSPSNSEIPPSTQSPFSQSMSRVSSGYPGLVPSPPIASSSSASNPLRLIGHTFSPSLISSAGISPQPGSAKSAQFNGLPKSLHGYKASIAQPNQRGRATSPYDHIISQSNSFGPGIPPMIQPLSSRQNSFSPSHPLQLPNMGEVLSPISQQNPFDQHGSVMPISTTQAHHGHFPSQANFMLPPNSIRNLPSPNTNLRRDGLPHTPDYRPQSRTPIEIAHPTPKTHRHNLSMALQKEIDEAEAVAREQDGYFDDEVGNTQTDTLRRDSNWGGSVNDEPPILRRPETIGDERSEIETNPSIAATPMLMDDKNPFTNWQTLSDAAKGETKSDGRASTEPVHATSKLNVQAKEFDPKGGFLSSNFSFGGDSPASFGLSSAPLPSVSKTVKLPNKNRLSISNLNAGAPAFTPSFMKSPPVPTIDEIPQTVATSSSQFNFTAETKPSQKSSFKFSSANFNVDAPVFNPSNSPTTNFKQSVLALDEKKAEQPDSIFGPVIINPESKVTRRASKPIPLTYPKHDNEASKSDSSEDEYEDDGGRPMPPLERQKRAKRTDSNGDRSLVYADSAPFHPSRKLSGIESDKNEPQQSPSNSGPAFEGWSYISADEKELKPRSESIHDRHANNLSTESATSFTFKNSDDAAKFNEALPPLDALTNLELVEEVENDKDVVEVIEYRPTSSNRRKPMSSLSALAKPFEFKPHVVSPQPPTVQIPPKPKGLESSRFAPQPSPQESSKGLSVDLSSPPADLYHYNPKPDEIGEETGNSDVEANALSATSEDDHESLLDAPITNDLPMEVPVSLSPVNDQRHHHDQEEEEEVDGPSFEEIDAVMKQFEVHPELGIERLDTPLQSTPLIHNEPLLGAFRSDAPSPNSPHHDLRTVRRESPFLASEGLQIGIHNLNSGREDISDWGGVLPADEESKLEIRSQFFDGHVNDLVDGILEHRLGPLEQTLQTIQQSLAMMANAQVAKHGRRSLSTDAKESDADDEEEYDAFEGYTQYRTRSPAARRDFIRQDKIRTAVVEAFTSLNLPTAQPPALDFTEFNDILQEIRQVALQTNSINTQHELRTIVEDVISNHPRLRGSRVQKDHDAVETKLQPKIDGLESMLIMTKEHASEEARLRRKAEEEVAELKLRLAIAEEDAAQHRESSEEAERTLVAFLEEKKSYKNLEEQLDNYTLKNTALETTLEEYRVSSDQWREDIREERSKNKALREILHGLHGQLEDQSQARGIFRQKVDRLQEDLTRVIQDSQSEQAEWRAREHKLLSNISLVEDALDQERHRRSKVESELIAVEMDLKSSVHFKAAFEQASVDINRLNEIISNLREENRSLDTKCFTLDRELDHTVKTRDAEVATTTAKLQAELESVKAQLHSIRTDSEAQISRLQSRLDHAELDIEDQKARHDGLLAETIEAHKEALRESNEKRESALEDQHQMHEKKLNDLRDRHTRELHNSFDNRTRLEHQLNERLALSEDKNKHLESKVADYEERLEAAKAAVRAAAEAAIAKGVNLPTPAPSVVASPPQRPASASISFVKNSDVPEKISPQALRESIMVLQDQLQNREMKIETLEAELAAVDKDAPQKIKDRDTEIGWLRELLGVRIDDLEDVINTLSQPDFDRESIKDAVIRLRANLQMEQQLKERASSGLTGSLPSIATLTSYAQSPRTLPMAAVAALSNWRKVRDNSIGTISDFATGVASQTPSRSTIGSPSSILSGIMTPPSTSQKVPTPTDRSAPPPSMRPLAAAAQGRKSSAEARPLRAYNSQPRTLSSRQQGKSIETSMSYSQPRSESPHTPTQSKRPSLDFADDVDEDASPLDGRHTNHLADVETISE